MNSSVHESIDHLHMYLSRLVCTIYQEHRFHIVFLFRLSKKFANMSEYLTIVCLDDFNG